MISLIPQSLLKAGFFVALAAVLFGIVMIIKNMLKGSKKQKVFNAVSLLCVLIMAVSWFMNFGWFRFALTIMPIPLVHIAVFLILINIAMKYEGKKFCIISVLTQITFLLTYLLFPDGGDIGGMYVFFGRIHSDTIAMVCWGISVCMFLVNAALLVSLAVMTSRARMKLKTETVKEEA